MYRCMILTLVLLTLIPFSRATAVEAQPGPQDGVDVWITDVFSYNDDYGVNDEKLQVGGWGDFYYTLLRFNLTGLPSQASSAKIDLYVFPRGDSSTFTGMYLDKLTSSWDENTGWNNRPTGVNIRTLSAPTAYGWYSIDITSLYNSWKSGAAANYGIRLRPTNNANNFNVFYSSDFSVNPSLRPKLTVIASTGISLSFPLRSYTPDNAPISSVFDHSMAEAFSTNGIVVAYTGETGNYQGYPGDSTCINRDGGPFTVNGNYVGASSCGGKYYLSYDGHPGIDYPVPLGTPVYSTADGTITLSECPKKSTGLSCTGRGTGYGKLVIDHGSGYQTAYNHLSYMADTVNVGSWYPRGTLVGYSGQTSPVSVGPHLHLSILKDGTYIDPYGWTGTGTDPYVTLHPGTQNIRLWE
jgi:murein DD-endopeptidase MepM/ murein hydrolase activator NlpD